MNKFNKKVIELLMTKKSTQRKSSNDNFSFNAEIQGYFLLIKVKFIFMQDFRCFTLKCSQMALIMRIESQWTDSSKCLSWTQRIGWCPTCVLFSENKTYTNLTKPNLTRVSQIPNWGGNPPRPL